MKLLAPVWLMLTSLNVV